MLISETRWAHKATRNDGDDLTRYQERTASVCNVGLETVQEMQ